MACIDELKRNANTALQEAMDWTINEDEAERLLDAILAWILAELEGDDD